MASKKKQDNPFTKIVSLEAPTYVNTTRVSMLSGVDFNLWDIVKAAMAARLNLGLYSGSGMGKSQLFADLRALFGNNASYVLGRNDLDIKSLFRELNFGKLVDAMNKGDVVAQRDITQVTGELYRPLLIVEEINRCAEIVQNQFFNIFEGFIELDGKRYSLGGTRAVTFKTPDGGELLKNIRYSMGVWSANFGNGGFTGTVSMDRAMKDRSHIIIDTDNFSPGNEDPTDLDDILFGSSGEVRLKEQEAPEDLSGLFSDAFVYLMQRSMTPHPEEFSKELLLFRYLVNGLDYIPAPNTGNSKRKMKDVWPRKAEEDDMGSTDEEKTLYRMIFPMSIRGALSVMSLARSMRDYALAKNSSAKPDVLGSVIEAFKLVAAYSGVIENPQRMAERYSGNPYIAACESAKAIQGRLEANTDLMEALISLRSNGQDIPKNVRDDCKGDFACWGDAGW